MNTKDNTYKLHIPEHRKDEIFLLVKEKFDEKVGESKYRDFKHLLKKTSVELKLANVFDARKEWDACIELTESKSPKNIFKFWNKIVKSSGIFKLKFNVGLCISERDKKLPFLVYTSLVEGLLADFNQEKDLFKCISYLNEAVPNLNVINWKKLEATHLISRLQGNWVAWLPLIQPYEINLQIKSDYKIIGLTINDFIKVFFSQDSFRPACLDDHSILINSDIAITIASFLKSKNLINFRKTCRTAYNAVESDAFLRFHHRIGFLNSSYVLRQFIGSPIFLGNGFLLSNVYSSRNPVTCRITSIINPILSETCYTCFVFEKLMGGCVCGDEKGNILILLAVACTLFDSSSELICIKIPSIEELKKTDLKHTRIHVKHNRREISVNDSEAAFTFQVNQNKVVIDAKFWKFYESNSFRFGRATFSNKYAQHQGSFNLTDFDLKDACIELRPVKNTTQ